MSLNETTRGAAANGSAGKEGKLKIALFCNHVTVELGAEARAGKSRRSRSIFVRKRQTTRSIKQIDTGRSMQPIVRRECRRYGGCSSSHTDSSHVSRAALLIKCGDSDAINWLEDAAAEEEEEEEEEEEAAAGRTAAWAVPHVFCITTDFLFKHRNNFRKDQNPSIPSFFEPKCS
jgi:hypothetical protein